MSKRSKRKKSQSRKNQSMRLTKSGCSLPEFTIYWWLKREFADAEYRAKPFGFELDIYIPSLKCGIEYDGRYWHEDKVEQDSIKDMKCVEHGIRLIRIRDYELPDTEHADRISFNELTWQELGPVVEQLFKALGRADVVVDMKNHLDEIYTRYNVENGNEVLYCVSLLSDLSKQVGSLKPVLGSADSAISNALNHVSYGWHNSPSVYAIDDSGFNDKDSDIALTLHSSELNHWLHHLPSQNLCALIFDSGSLSLYNHALIFSYQVEHFDEYSLVTVQWIIPEDGWSGKIQYGDAQYKCTGNSIVPVWCSLYKTDNDRDDLCSQTIFALRILTYIAYANKNCVSRYVSPRVAGVTVSSRKSMSDIEVHCVRDVAIRRYATDMNEYDAVSPVYRGYGTHASPVAHVRRGHYHHFWCGSGENRHLELRWVEETRVNWHDGDKLQTNVNLLTA